MKKQIYTPGPTEVHSEVLQAMVDPPTNPDFYTFLREVESKITRAMYSVLSFLIY